MASTALPAQPVANGVPIPAPSPTKKKQPYPFYLGGLAATIAASVTHPLDLTKVRLQASGDKRMIESMKKTVRTAGVRGLYDGITGTWMRQMSYSICRFWAYDESKKLLGATPQSPPWVLAAAGAMGTLYAQFTFYRPDLDMSPQLVPSLAWSVIPVVCVPMLYSTRPFPNLVSPTRRGRYGAYSPPTQYHMLSRVSSFAPEWSRDRFLPHCPHALTTYLGPPSRGLCQTSGETFQLQALFRCALSCKCLPTRRLFCLVSLSSFVSPSFFCFTCAGVHARVTIPFRDFAKYRLVPKSQGIRSPSGRGRILYA